MHARASRVAGTLVVSALLGVPATTDAADRGRCASAGSRTIIETPAVRVFTKRAGGASARSYYGCEQRRRRIWRLGPPRAVNLEMSSHGGFTSARTIVAFLRSETAFRASSAETRVIVQSLATGRRYTYAASTSVESPGGPVRRNFVPAHAVRSDGTIAWIARNAVLESFEVFVARARQQSLIDAGPDIDPSSLRLTRAGVSWRSGGQEHEHAYPERARR